MTDENSPETRLSSVMKGIKQGAIKGVVDNVVNQMAGPIAEAITKNLKASAPAMEILEPAVRAAISFIFIMGLAELMNFAAPMAGKVMPNFAGDNIEEKTRLLSIWMREYAGEKIGSEVVDAAVSFFPLIIGQFSGISLTDLKDVVGETGSSTQKALVPVEEEVLIRV